MCEKAEVTGYPSLKSYYNGESHATFRGEFHACTTIAGHSRAGSWRLLVSLVIDFRMKWAGGRSLEALQSYVDGAVKELTLETVF